LLYTTFGTQTSGTTQSQITFQRPAGVTTLSRIEAWGAGGGGSGSRTTNNGGPGGGGGGYGMVSNVVISGSNIYTLFVGVGGAGGTANNNKSISGFKGSPTTCNFPFTVTATGGEAGITTVAGGATTYSVGLGGDGFGEVEFSGGTGGARTTSYGGGGGGGAGTQAVGGNASGTNSNGGAGGNFFGGNGGNGGATISSVGQDGFLFGGGGGGAFTLGGVSDRRTGGAGACGAFGLSYTTRDSIIDNSTSRPGPADICAGSTNVPIHSFTLVPSNGNIAVTGPISISTGTGWVTGDIIRFNLYYSTSSSFATRTLLSTIENPTAADIQTFTFPTFFSFTRVHFLVTMDVSFGATGGSTVTVAGTLNSNVGAIPVPSGVPTSIASGTQTILEAPVPPVVQPFICNGAEEITGTSPSGTPVDIYRDGIFYASPVVSGTSWTLSSIDPPLEGNEKISARALGSNGCYSDTSAVVNVIPTALAGNIIGDDVICTSNITAAYASDGDAGGAWTSSNLGVATINPVTGLLTMVSEGTTTLQYFVTGTGGCPNAFVQKVITVERALFPGVISTTDSEICSKETTLYESDGDAGGLWTSFDISIAKVNLNSGLVTGISEGTTIIFTPLLVVMVALLQVCR
jgi:hypothetical protein